MSAKERLAGRFITFEGGEGSGKSVQARTLADRLRAAGCTVTLTREPGGSPGAEKIRALLLDGDPNQWTPLGELLLFSAARADHLERTIRPGLARDDVVICDRFMDSTRVYQGAGQGLSASVIDTVNRLVLGPTTPDLTLILDVDVDTGLARARARGAETRYERFDRSFHERLRKGYLEIAASEPERCILIDSRNDQGEVARMIWAAVARKFGL